MGKIGLENGKNGSVSGLRRRIGGVAVGRMPARRGAADACARGVQERLEG